VQSDVVKIERASKRKKESMDLTPEQWLICWAVLELKALDAEHGDFDQGLVELELLEKAPTAEELRIIANEAQTHLTPDMGSDD
jgi:hypothetical protein